MEGTTTVKIVEMDEGRKIAFEQDGYKLTFGDDVLSLRCDKFQRDYDVHKDICADKDRNLVIGMAEGLWYVAQVDIPARKYTETEVEEEGETVIKREPLPLDMADVTLSLWSIEGYLPEDGSIESEE